MEWVAVDPKSTELMDFGDGVKIPTYEVMRKLAIEAIDDGVEDEDVEIDMMMRELENMLTQPATSAITDFILAYKMVSKCKEMIEEKGESNKESEKYKILQIGYESVEKITFSHSVGAEVGISYEDYKKLDRAEIDVMIEKTYNS